MRAMGLRGAVRGKTVKTTVQNPAALCPLDRVRRQFHAPGPDRLWVGDFTPAPAGAGSTWRHGRASPTQPSSSTPTRDASRAGRVSRTATAGFVAGALEQAIHQRRPAKGAGLVAHSDRGSQHLAIRHDLGASSRRGSSPPSAQSGTPTTTRWPRR